MSKKQPEMNRLIACNGADCFGEFSCTGKFIPYKDDPSRGRFFMKMTDGTFELARDTWHDVESWEYEDTHALRAQGSKE